MVSFILINPKADIEAAIKNKKWFSGFANAVSYFEHFGVIKLRNYFDKRILEPIEDNEIRKKVACQLNNDFGKKLERLRVRDITFLLYTFNLVDSETYLQMRTITTERNKLVHPSRKGIGWRYRKPRRTAIPLLEQAILCIEKISEVQV